MTLSFANPWLLLLLLPLVLLAWLLPRLALTRPLRAAALVALVIALAGPRTERRERGLDLVVLLDRSASAAGLVEAGQREWIELLERSRPDESHRLHVWDVAAGAHRRPQPDQAVPLVTGEEFESRLPTALSTVLAARDPRRPTRVLALTDGQVTEGWGELASRLADDGVPLDLRLLGAPLGDDFQVESLAAPQRVRPGEPFLLRTRVSGPPGGRVRAVIEDADESLHEEELVLDPRGEGHLTLRRRLATPGARRHTLRLLTVGDEADPVPGNDVAHVWTEVAASQRVLLLSKHPDDAIARYLAEQGFVIDHLLLPEQPVAASRIDGAELVILHNIPADEVDDEFRRTLAFAVAEQGTGLLMVGGRESFGNGGWFGSPLDPLLPVSMELKEEHRRLASALAISLDRSGSMSMPVAGARTKMDLAAEGTARAIRLLGGSDQVAVFAVDTQAHEIVGLSDLSRRTKILQAVRGIRHGGGGIYVGEALEASWKELSESDLDNRHLLLFADAADAEQPGDFQKICAAVTGAGGVVSVIGLGTQEDPDAKLLQEIATLGGGRCLFTQDPARLPELFAQETVALARSAFLREPVTTRATGDWAELASGTPAWLEQVDGYNLCYLRPGATAALRSGDEYAAPLVAWQAAGLGRSAAITFPLGGEHSESARAWPDLGDFLQSLARWLAGDPLPPELALRTRIEGQELVAEAWIDTSTLAAGATSPPDLVIASGEGAETVESPAWQRLEPGHFELRRSLSPGRTLRGALQWRGTALPFGPLAVGVEAEWRHNPGRVETLRRLSRASGGRELTNLGEAWKGLELNTVQPLHVPLLLVALLLFLADALLTRTGWRLPTLARRKGPGAADPVDAPEAIPADRSEGKSKTGDAGTPTAAAPSSAEQAIEEAALRRERFRRARRR